MNKRSVLTTLSATIDFNQWQRSEVMIVGGVASIIHGLRDETEDIDVFVSERIFDDATFKVPEAITEEIPACGTLPACTILDAGNITYHLVGTLPDYPTFIHRRFNVLTKLGLLMYRIDLGRKKDMSDIIQLKNRWEELPAEYKQRLEILRGKS